MIYTKINSNQIVIHDKNDLSIIYDVIDSKPHGNVSFKMNLIKQKLIHLANLSKKRRPLERKEINNVSPYLNKASPHYYLSLIDGIRSQTGQKDRISIGIERSASYEKFIVSLTHQMKIPRELKSISFLESSFNPAATSRVGAKGVWQLMPSIGKKLLPKSSVVDYRENIALSSASALHLLKQNYRILKSWDKAITAYNSGLGQFLGKRNPRRLKFASRNFYPEFLALTHALAYRDNIYRYSKRKNFPLMKVYLASCSRQIKNFWGEIQKHNHHIESHQLSNSKMFFTTPKKLKGFKQVSLAILATKTPAQIDKDLNYNCSTR